MFQVVIGGPNILPVVWMDSLQEILDEVSCPVIVEGNSDRDALEKFGVIHIIPLNGEPLFKAASSISKDADEVLVLTDFDKEGEKLAKKLNEFLTSFGVVPKTKTRGKIKYIVTKDGVSAIESLEP